MTNLKKYKFSDYISVLIPFVLFYSFVLQTPLITVLSLFISIFCLFYYLFFFKLRYNSALLVAVLFFTCSLGMFKISHDISKLFYLVQFSVLLILCQFISENPRRYFKTIKALFYSFLILSYYVLIVNFEKHEPLSHFIEGSSQNGIPSYLLILFLSYLFCSLYFDRKLPLLPAILCLVISFYGEGRGSLVISIAVFLICYLYLFLKPNPTKGFSGKLLVLSAISIAVVFSINFTFIVDFVVTGSKLSVGLKDTNRLDILYSYLDSLTYYEILVGGSYDDNIVSTKYLGNPHIAYVRLHAFFGLLPVILVILSPLMILFKKLSINNFFLFLIISLYLARAISEPVLFPTALDFFYFMSFFIFFHKYRIL